MTIKLTLYELQNSDKSKRSVQTLDHLVWENEMLKTSTLRKSKAGREEILKWHEGGSGKGWSDGSETRTVEGRKEEWKEMVNKTNKKVGMKEEKREICDKRKA